MSYYRNNPYNMRNNRMEAVGPSCPINPYNESTDEMYDIAIASVAWQHFGPIYDEAKGYMVGTVFPCLNKPFMRGGNCK